MGTERANRRGCGAVGRSCVASLGRTGTCNELVFIRTSHGENPRRAVLGSGGMRQSCDKLVSALVHQLSDNLDDCNTLTQG